MATYFKSKLGNQDPYVIGKGTTFSHLIKHLMIISIGFILIYSMHKIPYNYFKGISILLIFIFVMRNTSYGRKLYAVGGNQEVARLAGYNIKLLKLSAFVICSFLSSISAIILASRIGSANHVAGDLFEFQVVAAVVLGGVSLAGGIGSLTGAAIGVLILSVISNGLGLLNIDTQWQLVVNGVIIIIAVGFDELKRNRSL